MSIGTIFGSVVAAATLCACGLAAPQAGAPGQDFQWRGIVAPGRTVEIRGINGNIAAESSKSGQVEVTAVKHARRDDPASVKIDVVEHAGGVTICAVYPSGDPGRPNECKPGGGRMNVRNNDVSVDFKVLLPAGLRLAANTVNGRIEAYGVAGEVAANTVNGNVELTASGPGEAKTVNGAISASFDKVAWTKPVAFTTVNGSITLALPDDVKAHLEASTVHGDIATEFGLSVSGRFLGRRLSGDLGGGGPGVTLKTVNGTIRVRRSTI